MQRAYALAQARDRVVQGRYLYGSEDDEYVGGGRWVLSERVDQGRRYARAIAELLYGGEAR
jgi:hypothetical protein